MLRAFLHRSARHLQLALEALRRCDALGIGVSASNFSRFIKLTQLSGRLATRITPFAFAAVCRLPIGTVFGQQSGSGAAVSTKSALLAPAGFMYDGDCIDGRVFSGGPLAFKEQGDKLSVKLVGGAGTCEAPVELSGDKFEFTGCAGVIIKVVHSPSNVHEPFRGKFGGYCNYFMKPR